MSVSAENWGQVKLTHVKSEVKLEDGVEAKVNQQGVVQLLSTPSAGRDKAANFVSKPILSVPISAVATASGTTKNDLTLTMRPQASTMPGSDVELTSIRFAIPDVCVGYEQVEQPGKAILAEVQDTMKDYQKQFLRAHNQGSEDDNLLLLATLGGGVVKREDETVVAIFDDVNLSYPTGKFKLVISNYNLVLEDKRKTSASGNIISVPLSDIQHLYICDVPNSFSATPTGDEQEACAEYIMLVLKSPLKVRTTTYANIVISCPARWELSDEHPWRCELKTQKEIDAVTGFNTKGDGGECPLAPSMSGKVSQIIFQTIKAIAKVPVYPGENKEFHTALTQRRHSCLRCMYRGTEGLLYVLGKALLFLHRPATKLSYSDVHHVEMNEAESGSVTFHLTVYLGATGKDKHVFSAMDKKEKDGLLQYLEGKVKVVHIGMNDDDDESDGDEEEEDEEDSDADDGDTDESDGDDDDDFDSDDDDDADDDDDGAKKSRKRKREEKPEKKEKKHKKEKKSKKDKKDKKDKKHKKEKKHKKDKKDKKHKKEKKHRHDDDE